ncbi:hypothetical protein NMY22_g9731 [Coprinellus aureogranulatus]|nr:hypothetical protein NMY22_g9731 [Coprinellus aureogranulatus]
MSEGSGTSIPLSVTLEQVQQIIRKHVGITNGFNDSITVTNLQEIKDYGYSASSVSKIYIVDLHSGTGGQNTTACSFLAISRSSPTSQRNTLPIITQLLTRIRKSTSIPISDSILDTSHTITPFDFLLSPPTPFPSSSIVTLRDAKASGYLNAQTQALIDLQLGKYLAELHLNVQNDWFGLPVLSANPDADGKGPSKPPADTEPQCYSWQETFTLLFEELLDSLKSKLGSESSEFTIPFEAIHTSMSRAIAFFLFDDAEVPSLIWLTGSDTDIYLSLPSHGSTKTPGIVAILPSMPHMLWGDPLLESFFIPLGLGGSVESSKAIVEGYLGSGGSLLVSFPRQKTKRTWYTLFLALSHLNDYLSGEDPIPATKKQWIQETIHTCTEQLKTASCY